MHREREFARGVIGFVVVHARVRREESAARRVSPAGRRRSARASSGSWPVCTRGTSQMVELIGAFESTYLPKHDRDVFETTGHATRWRDDLELLATSGVTRLRYPV